VVSLNLAHPVGLFDYAEFQETNSGD